MKLATIRDATEEQEVLDLITSTENNLTSMWIGLNDASTEGTEAWDSGNTSTFRGTIDAANMLTNDCVRVLPEGKKWYWDSCTRAIGGYVCSSL